MLAEQDKPFIKNLTAYIKRKSSSNPSLSPLSQLVTDSENPPSIGLILTERLINIPAEVVPPMYSMLQEEISWAVEEKEPYNFTHYLILSKTYEEVESKLDVQESRPQKKKKKATAEDNKEANKFYFHPEDEILERHTLCHGTFEYTHKQEEGASDSKRAFQDYGIKPAGSLMLIEEKKFGDAVKAITDYLKPPV